MSTSPSMTSEELVALVNDWCEDHGLVPASGQSADQLSMRTLRYYRTLGLLGAPVGGARQGYNEMHRLQLLAIRVLQARGQPLRRIQSLLYGRTEKELRVVVEKGKLNAPASAAAMLPAAENWNVLPFDDTAWLVLRRGRTVTGDQISRIQAILESHSSKSLQLKLERTS